MCVLSCLVRSDLQLKLFPFNCWQVARAQHVQAESYLVYSVMSSGEVECSNSLEDATDQALPSQAFVYRPVRQRVYSLLLGGGGGELWSPGAMHLELVLRTGWVERVQAFRTQDLFLCIRVSKGITVRGPDPAQPRPEPNRRHPPSPITCLVSNLYFLANTEFLQQRA